MAASASKYSGSSAFFSAAHALFSSNNLFMACISYFFFYYLMYTHYGVIMNSRLVMHQLMTGFKSTFFDFNDDIFQVCMLKKFIYDIDDVLVNEICPGHVDQHICIGWYRFEFFFYYRFIEERNIFPESDK